MVILFYFIVVGNWIIELDRARLTSDWNKVLFLFWNEIDSSVSRTKSYTRKGLSLAAHLRLPSNFINANRQTIWGTELSMQCAAYAIQITTNWQKVVPHKTSHHTMNKKKKKKDSFSKQISSPVFYERIARLPADLPKQCSKSVFQTYVESIKHICVSLQLCEMVFARE